MATKKSGVGTAVEVGVAAAISAAAVAGAYWFYGAEHAQKNRKQVKSWMLKARAEALERLEQIAEVDKKVYAQVVDEVASRYSAVDGATSADIAQIQRDLKSAWQHVQHARAEAKAALAAKAAKKSAKKPAKKVSRKSR